jgi:ABC-type Fe3+ transport system permease subunit
MEYLIIIAFQILGIGFHVSTKIIGIRSRNVGYKIKEVLQIFIDEDWNTLFMSGWVLLFDLLVHFVINYYAPDFHKRLVSIPLFISNAVLIVPVVVLSFAVAFLLGYGGQRIIYKYLGTAEKFISNKADKIQ